MGRHQGFISKGEAQSMCMGQDFVGDLGKLIRAQADHWAIGNRFKAVKTHDTLKIAAIDNVDLKVEKTTVQSIQSQGFKPVIKVIQRTTAFVEQDGSPVFAFGPHSLTYFGKEMTHMENS
jgi:hypothetical protein